VRAVVLLFPGTNRERDMALALERATGQSPEILFHRETELPAGTDLVVLPGGFSHGDYLRSGAMAARAPIMPAVRAFAEAGGHVLGVCNGFQILTEAGLLPGALLRNAGLRFLAMDCHLRVETAATPWTRGYREGEVFACPMAHGDGNFFADDATLDALQGEGRVVFRYCDETGAVTDAANRNGAARGIAGICSPNRRVLGLMPHPENATDAAMGGTGGLPLFAGLAALASA
jgi:phosphoribosylformylglycinamidine synthase subunit PurQ / glutaminase